ncbi:MAG: ATP-binding cassette domain-containing protein [Chloroflexota bacterium]
MTDGNRNLLQITKVQKRYRGRTVLSIDSFALAEGDKINLQGRNGSGKSTFLRLLAGISAPTSGQLGATDAFRHLTVGYVPQAGGLYEDMTLRQNLAIFSRLYCNRPPLENDEILAEAGLARFLDVPVGVLSGGFQKLAALTCALAGRPNALLLDEPTVDLDKQHARQIHDILEKLVSTLSFIVVSSHDAPVFPFLARNVVLIDGHIV